MTKMWMKINKFELESQSGSKIWWRLSRKRGTLKWRCWCRSQWIHWCISQGEFCWRWCYKRQSMQCEIGLLCHFQRKRGDYCLLEEETMVQDRKWKSNAASLGLWNNYGTSPLIFRAATFLLAKSSQVLKCLGVAGAWCDRRISLMSVWLWELFENLFTLLLQRWRNQKRASGWKCVEGVMCRA